VGVLLSKPPFSMLCASALTHAVNATIAARRFCFIGFSLPELRAA
jgi:hypothetical protein